MIFRPIMTRHGMAHDKAEYVKFLTIRTAIKHLVLVPHPNAPIPKNTCFFIMRYNHMSSGISSPSR